MADALPIRTTAEDVSAVCGYLATKPIGASSAEIKAVLDDGAMDGRKVSAYKFWGLIEEAEGKVKLKERGRLISKDKGAHKDRGFMGIVKAVPAYSAIVERAMHKGEGVFSAVEVATHWHEHFRQVSSANEKILNDQAVCFFQVAQGAGLGVMIQGRRGQPTRFEFTDDGLEAFASGAKPAAALAENESEEEEAVAEAELPFSPATPLADRTFNNKVFITHGKNKKVLEQIKEIVAYGSYTPVVATERESTAKPVPEKVMDDMRSCSAAVIHVSIEGKHIDDDGKEHPAINPNVLIEIGAAMALYKRNFILVVEEGAKLPSNLQGLYECRYVGDELTMQATMKLLKAFKEFRE